ncbi:succinate-acetate transporter protein [Nakamurella sp. UYEF19]|uniref:GPR1/FUN34/YaaH family transporter n=1 Tax=Nakamurella sp. UYEF19 TaxID=1756392 RepID=UPI003393A1C9
MTATITPTPAAERPVPAPVQPEPAAPVGNPAIVGVPLFAVGSIALGLQQVGFVSAAGGGAPLAIILAATGLGTLLAAVWAISLGQSAVAGIFAIFAGFWLSYAALILGLTHNWYAVAAADVTSTVELFLISWLVVIVLLTVGTLRLPLAFTAVFVLIDLSLIATLIATASASTGMGYLGGYLALAFAAVGAYIFVDSCIQTTGGAGLPLGTPVQH